VSVESASGEVVDAANVIEKALEENDDGALIRSMYSIESCVAFITEVVPTLRERLEPAVFRNKIRQLLYGHDQVRFAGVEGNPTVTYVGVSGAQSGIVRAVDAILGVQHSGAMASSMKPFSACASESHRDFFARASRLGSRLAALRGNSRLSQARRMALASLVRFREVHLDVVSDYLKSGEETAERKGTGGTNFDSWLLDLIHETQEAASQA